MFSRHSLFIFLTAVIINLGFQTLLVEGQCGAGGGGCLACNTSAGASPGDCISCSSLNGLTATSPRTCKACNTNPTCSNCTYLALCTKCFTAGNVPIQDGSGGCGPCSSNCKPRMCSTNGGGKCDACNPGYLLDSSTKLCDTCQVGNCSDCSSGVSTCNMCMPKFGFVAGSNKGKCAPCSVPCNFCTTNGASMCDPAGCDDPYAYNTATSTCAPCAANCTSCKTNGPALCDTGNCSPGYAINSSKTCAQCSMYCSMCAATGAGLCDGAAYCSNVSTYDAGSKKCNLKTTTAPPTTTGPTTTTVPTTTGPPGPFVSRSTWGAAASRSPLPALSSNCPYVVLHHTRNNCSNSASCKSLMKGIQTSNMNLQANNTVQRPAPLRDFAYNFAIASDGTIYEGVGWYSQGQHTYGLNDKSLGVAIIGTFTSELPSSKALAAITTLINQGLSGGQYAGQLSQGYKIYPHKDVECTTCPGGTFYTYITGMTHYGGKSGYPSLACQSYSSGIHPQK